MLVELFAFSIWCLGLEMHCFRSIQPAANNNNISFNLQVEMKNPKMFDHGSTATVYQAKYQNNNYAVKLFFDTIPMPEILTEVAMLRYCDKLAVTMH